MADQVQALEARGVAATYLAATLDASEMRRRMGRLAGGAFSLVYVAPERLAFPGFRAMLRDLDVPLVAIDEAHCISEWGHDFRPEYLGIGAVIGDFPSARVLACTATATPDRARRDPRPPGPAPGHAPDGARLRAPEPGPARGGGGRPPRAGAPGRRRAGRGARRARPGRGHRHRLRPHPEAGGRGDRAPGRARLADRGLPRRARRAHAGDRPARLRGGPDRGGGRHQCLRHGHRSTRRPRGHPPGAPRLDRGVLPGGRPRGPRRGARARPAAGRRGRPRAAPGAARARLRGQRAGPGGGRAQVGDVPRADSLGRGGKLPSRCDSSLLRRRGGDAGRLRPLRRLPGARGRRGGGRSGAGDAHRAQGALGGGPRPRPVRPADRGQADPGRGRRAPRARRPHPRADLRQPEGARRPLAAGAAATLRLGGLGELHRPRAPGGRPDRRGARGHEGGAPGAPAPAAADPARRRRPRRRPRG